MRDLICRRAIKAKSAQSPNRLHAPEWRALARSGRLNTLLLPEVWPQLPPCERESILRLMLRFGLCCRVRAAHEPHAPRGLSGQAHGPVLGRTASQPPLRMGGSGGGGGGSYVVPSLLPAYVPSDEQDLWRSPQCHECFLCFAHKSSATFTFGWGSELLASGGGGGACTHRRGWLPEGAFSALLAALLSGACAGPSGDSGMFHQIFADRACVFGEEDFLLERKRPEAHGPSTLTLLLPLPLPLPCAPRATPST